MKKFTLLMLALVMGCAMGFADRISRELSVLPTAAQNTVNTHFKKIGLSHIKIEDKAFGNKEYDVILLDGTEISFDKNGNWEEIERNRQEAVPAALIPNQISTYVTKNYKGQKIVQIKKKRNKYEIELSNGIDLEFDRAGRFLRIDN